MSNEAKLDWVGWQGNISYLWVPLNLVLNLEISL
jgi:hypothetical protein